MAAYQEHYLSLVRFMQQFSQDVATTLNISAPTFVNFDAHADIEELPPTDCVGLVSFGTHTSGKFTDVICGFVVSTIGDPDLLRLISIMDMLADRLEPEKQVPLFTLVGGVPTKTSWMVVADSVSIEPVSGSHYRSMQVLTAPLKSGRTAGGA